MILSIIIAIGIITSIILTPNADALLQNREYVILSEKYFFVFGLDEQSNMFVRDGGILYDSKWRMINMTANIEVKQYDDSGNLGWIIGHLKSGEKFRFTWNVTINSDVVTGAWVYDGEIITEMTDYKAYMTRLFF